MSCRQYDDVIFLELSDNEREDYRKCFTEDISYEGLLVNINFLDIYMSKRLSASFKSEYNFEDTFLKPAQIAFQKSGPQIWSPLEVDSSSMLTSPFAHSLPTAYIQINKPISDYEHIFLTCIEKSDGNMSLEEYLKELEKVIASFEEAIAQKIVACKTLIYAIKEEEKNKLNLPYTITDLKTDYDLAQNTYIIEKGKYDDILDTKKQVDKEFSYLVKEKDRLQRELHEATAILKSLGVVDLEKKDSAKRVEGVDESIDEAEEKLQKKDPTVEIEMNKGTPPATYSGVLGVIYNVLYGTWYVLKVAWYGIKTINYGVRKTWVIASDIKGFLQDKPAQIQLGKLLYKEVKNKMLDIDADIKTLQNEHAHSETIIANSYKEGLNEPTIDILQKNVDITFERLRRFEYARETAVGPKMKVIFEEIYTTIWTRLQLSSTKEQGFLLSLIQFPSRFTLENFLTENESAYLTEEEIGINISDLIGMAIKQVKINKKNLPLSSMPKMRRVINNSPYQMDKDTMESVMDCTNQLIVPSYDDYLIAYNQAASQKWSGLIC